MATVHELGRPPVEVRLRVPGQPVGKARPRMGRGGRVYTPAPTRAYEQLVAGEWQTAGARRLPDGAPFMLLAEFVFARPASHYRTKARLLRTDAPVLPRVDLDNCCKTIDALNGLAFADDRLCAEIHATKRWAGPGEQPHATIVLRAV